MASKQPIFSQDITTAPAKWALLLSLCFVFSLSAESRIGFGGLLVHPFLLLIPVAIVITQVNILSIPSKVLYPLLLFFFTLSIASLQNSNPFSETFKVGASILTFLFFSVSVKTEKDFRMVSWGFVIVASVIGVTGFGLSQEDDASRLTGINVLEGLGNKNAQSLFTLPGLFLGLYLMFYFNANRKYFSIVVVAILLFFIIVQFFLSANRSGWLGLIVIFITFLLYSGIRRATFFAASFLLFSCYIAIEVFASDIVEHKSRQTLEGYSSDNFRKILIIESFNVGLENPILGKGLEGLQVRLAEVVRAKQRLGIERIDPHNLLGYLFGGCGLFTFMFFLRFLINLASKYHLVFTSNSDVNGVKKARILLISFVILFVIRSFFSREILYSPTFIGALGLIHGFYLMRLRNGRPFTR